MNVIVSSDEDLCSVRNSFDIREIHKFSWSLRIYMENCIIKSLPNKIDFCPIDLIGSVFEQNIGNRLLGEGGFGKIYNTKPIGYDFEIVIKEVSAQDQEREKRLLDNNDPELVVWHTISQKIIRDTGFPHYPLLFGFSYCNIEIDSREVQENYKIDFFTERFDGSIDKILFKASNEMLESFLMQVLLALACAQHILGLCHKDIKAENFLFKQIKYGGCWKYNFRGEEYYVPNYGYQIYLHDFGNSELCDPDYSGKNIKGIKEYGDRSIYIEGDTAKKINYQRTNISADFDDFSQRKEDEYFFSHVLTEKDHLSPDIDINLKDFDTFPPSGFAVDNINVLRMFVGGSQYMGYEYHSKSKIKRIKELSSLCNIKNLDSILDTPGYSYLFSANEILKKLFRNSDTFEANEILVEYIIY
jgi:serine/threonine protein kinase